MKRKSQHWFILTLTLMIPAMTLGMSQWDGLLIEPMNPLKSLYMGAAMWWLFALISGLPKDVEPREPYSIKYVRWLLVLPVSMIAVNWVTPFDGYAEVISVFNAVLITWGGCVLWILIDWYRWKFNPSKRQWKLIKYNERVAEWRAKIDKIPNCVVPSGLQIITQE